MTTTYILKCDICGVTKHYQQGPQWHRGEAWYRVSSLKVDDGADPAELDYCDLCWGKVEAAIQRVRRCSEVAG